MANYGFEDSSTVKIEHSGMPVGLYRVYVTDEVDYSEGVKLNVDILTGNNAGEKAVMWFKTLSQLDWLASQSRGQLAKIGTVTGTSIKPESAPIKGRIFCVEYVADKDPQYTKLKDVYAPDHIADVSVKIKKEAF